MAVNVRVLDASRQLRAAGVPEPQAEAILSAVAAVMPDDLTTRSVIRAFEQRMAIRLLATVGGSVGIVLTGMGIATAVILAAV